MYCFTIALFQKLRARRRIYDRTLAAESFDRDPAKDQIELSPVDLLAADEAAAHRDAADYLDVIIEAYLMAPPLAPREKRLRRPAQIANLYLCANFLRKLASERFRVRFAERPGTRATDRLTSTAKARIRHGCTRPPLGTKTHRPRF